jgi:hypothetical protein
MVKGIVALGVLTLAVAGCGGTVGAVPDDFATYKFDAKVAVNPTQPLANKRVSFTLEVTSSSNRAVKTDIVLKVISAQGETMYQSNWDDVLFHENEVWNLTQGFLPDSNAAKTAWNVQITVRDHATGDVLFDQAAARLDFTN